MDPASAAGIAMDRTLPDDRQDKYYTRNPAKGAMVRITKRSPHLLRRMFPLCVRVTAPFRPFHGRAHGLLRSFIDAVTLAAMQ
jgi:hypothetical protein